MSVETLSVGVLGHEIAQLAQQSAPVGPPPDEEPRRYTFLLSLWRERDGSPWRAALRTAERRGFAAGRVGAVPWIFEQWGQTP